MKKIYLLLMALAFCFTGSAQILNEPAGWPNPQWTLTGSYSSASGALEANPATTANFAFDDDDAGSTSDDAVNAESPVIDLTAAHAAGETSLKITVEYLFRKNGNDEVMQFQYWDADAAAWVLWSNIPSNDSSTPDLFCTGTKTVLVSPILSIFSFTPTQLSGFKYRIRWDDSVAGPGYQWGFCFNPPTIQSMSCADPENLNLTSVTTTTATLGWTLNPAVTLYNVEYGEPGFTQGSGTIVSGVSNPTTITDLDPQTKYDYYVQSNCSTAGLSDWSGPFTFMTACDPVADFNENFDTSTTGTIMPTCWNSIVETENQYANVRIIDYESFSGANSVELYNDNDTNAALYLVSPNVNGMTNMRVKFRAISGDSGYTLQVGTMTSPSNPNTFTLVETKTLTESFVDYNVTLNGSTGTYIAFKHGLGGSYRTILIDNIIFEEMPSAVPECTSDVVVTPNASCGNFPTTFAWAPAEGADGYRLKIGTASGGTDVVNNIDLGNITEYTLVALYGTEYFYTITAYNAFGDAIGCTEDTFSTAPDGCYCTSVPTSNDGLGITNVQVGTTDFIITDETYTDKTGDGSVDLPQAISSNVQVTLNTEVEGDSYTYDTYVWVDFNDDFDFTENELVFVGEALAESPTTLNASFIMPLDAPLGEHRMRIGTSDGGQSPPDPCYSGTYGNTVDLLINVVLAPTCMPPTAITFESIASDAASVSWTSAAESFNIEYGNGPLILGSGTVINAVTAQNYSFTLLDAQTSYQFYIQANCGSGDLSPWIGPFTFKTACDPFSGFTEEFTGIDYDVIPACWSKIKNSDDDYVLVGGSGFSDEVQLYNSGDEDAELLLISPQLTELALNTHRVKFKARGDGYVLLVGTMTNFTDANTFNLVQTITLTDEMAEYNVPFNTSSPGSFVAFKHGLDDVYQTITIDDFIWEAIPTAIPACVEDILVTPDSSCGNFETSFSWAAVEGADGYKLTIGTTSGSSNVLDNVDLGNALEYAFAGDFNTTYFYKLVAYNLVGSAVNCMEDSFTTAVDGCYCTSVPLSNDGLGITNIQLAATDFVTDDEMYIDKTAEGTLNFMQGATANVQVTFNTLTDTSSYDYDAHVWIDFNDNFTFDENELMVSGTSEAESPSVLDLSFLMPSDAALGAHRMRIGSADNGQFEPNPCYSDEYGVTVDFLINVVVLSNEEFVASTLKAYPNPVKNILSLEYAKNISNVEVFNLLGQSVIIKEVNATQSQIDMSNLATGTYLVKVTSDNLVKTIKVVKQ